MKRIWFLLRVATINVVVLVALVAGIEVYFRATASPANLDPGGNMIWQRFHPYVMFHSLPTVYTGWVDRYTGENIGANVTTNGLGFRDAREFSTTETYEKSPGERVVLFTGGSTAWGVGASGDDKTVASRLEAYLNEAQDEVTYTVINMAMGSWIAYQQFIGLDLWGRQFDPDWVVVLDGANDATVVCASSQGVGNPMYTAVMRAYVDGYLGTQLQPPFYRGWFENELIRFSAAYRELTGKKVVPNTLHIDEAKSDAFLQRVAIEPLSARESFSHTAFYVKSQRAVADLFDGTKTLFAFQPFPNPSHLEFPWTEPGIDDPEIVKRDHMALVDSGILALPEGLQCGQEAFLSHPVVYYQKVLLATALEDLVQDLRENGKDAYYTNTGPWFPADPDERKSYFIDAVHLKDSGMDIVAKGLAEHVLKADGF
ncbi:SGNH/GDSL hydrolase family protein [Pacificispira sp.]|uniref:SGNH/GDSL hydrolase family protein n=1 Tax=Pacificispira sp. TaxID=2888761 RepID=UPI003B5285EC